MTRAFINDAGGKFKVPLKGNDGSTVAHLLWGDPVTVEKTKGEQSRVRSGRWEEGGWVPTSVIGPEGLLELYIIDVGKGGWRLDADAR